MTFSISILIIQACSSHKQEQNTTPKPSNLSGEALAQTYCASCHQYPSPDLLDKTTWQKSVLPDMGRRLGIGDNFKMMMTMNAEDLEAVMQANIYPDKPVLAPQDWQKIIDFYVEKAPEKPIAQGNKPVFAKQNTLFKVHRFFEKNNRTPMTTLVKIDEQHQRIYVGSRKNYLEILDKKGKRIDSIATKSAVADVDFSEQLQLLSMGVMDPNDRRKGQLQIGNQVILDSLRRPVQMAWGDLNQDGKQDVVVCSYGNEIGELAWYDGNKKHLLKALPGARKAIITDLNHDKLPDIVVLMAQAREGVFVFYNKGAGNFEEETLLQFPPVYGSSYIALADFNADGFEDILYTNGDNSDLSPILKAYHGVRIFLNDTHNHFKESYFYALYGASKAEVADFDADGDLDIAVISYFPAKPEEGFVYLENTGNNQFAPQLFKEVNQGNWLVMDVADVDADGDKDIVLGAFKLSMSAQKLAKIILLENKKK